MHDRESDYEDRWPRNWNPGQPEHLHALGVIGITYATFEQSIDLLCQPTDRPEYLRLNSIERIKQLKVWFAQNDTELSDSASNLLDYFDICAWNRNQLLHAERYPPAFGGDGESLHLIKRLSKLSDKAGYLKLSLDELRRTAEEMRRGVVQCAEIHIFRRFRHAPRPQIPDMYWAYIKDGPPGPIAMPMRLVLEPAPISR